MKRLVAVLPLALAGFVAVAGCGDRANTTAKVVRDGTPRDAAEAATAIGENVRKQRDEFVSKMEGELDDMNKQLKEWREKAKSASGEARERMQKKVNELEKQYQEARRHLGEVREDSKGAWQELRAGFQSAYGELRKSFKRAREEFK